MTPWPLAGATAWLPGVVGTAPWQALSEKTATMAAAKTRDDKGENLQKRTSVKRSGVIPDICLLDVARTKVHAAARPRPSGPFVGGEPVHVTARPGRHGERAERHAAVQPRHVGPGPEGPEQQD